MQNIGKIVDDYIVKRRIAGEVVTWLEVAKFRQTLWEQQLLSAKADVVLYRSLLADERRRVRNWEKFPDAPAIQSGIEP